MNRRLAKHLVPIGVAVVGFTVAGCASLGAQHETAAAQAGPATSAIVSPAAPTPAGPAPAAAVPAAAVAATIATDAAAPHFDTPDAAMRYLVEAYNANDETSVRHVTTPDSRDQFETERQWVQAFRFDKCTADGGPNWDYTCVLDIAATMPGVEAAAHPAGAQIMDEVTVLVAPAARTGYYLEANEGCGDGSEVSATG